MNVREALDIARTAVWARMDQLDPTGKDFNSRTMKEMNEVVKVLERLMDEHE